MGRPDAVLRRAGLMHAAGAGILDVAVIGTGMERAMDIFQDKLASRRAAIG
jgi:hypothetical protein